MKGWNDDDERVRPISFEDDGSVPSSNIDPDPTKSDSHRTRPWIPMVLVGGSIALVLGIVSVLGALEFETPSSSGPPSFSSPLADSGAGAETPPATLSPTLEESLPGLTDRLTLVALTPGGIATLLWDPSFRIPREYPLSVPLTDGVRAVFARFDSAGRSLAIETRSTTGDYSVYLGDPTDLASEPTLISNSQIAWHASEIGALAWIAAGDTTGAFELHTGSVNPLTGVVMDDVVVATLDAPVRVVRWDTSGFILDDGARVRSFDPSGRALWSREGTSPSVTPSLVALKVLDDDTGEPRWVVLDRETGDPTSTTIPGPPNDVTVVASLDLDIIATVSGNDTRSTLTVAGPDLAAKRIVQVDADVTPIGFTTGNSYMVFEVLGTNDLVFVNWRSGATQSLEIPDSYEILALDLG